MPLNFTAAHSSRVTKRPRTKIPLLKHSSSSSFSDFSRRKPTSKPKPKDDELLDDDQYSGDRFENKCLVKTLATDLNLRDVAQAITYIRSHMFDSIPKSGGFNSIRIAEILNFQKALPPSITTAHLHGLIASPTMVEREISELARAGTIKKVTVHGRGIGRSNIGDGLALTRDMITLLRDTTGIGTDLADKFQRDLESASTVQALQFPGYTAADIHLLMRAGFITNNFASQSLSTAYPSFESSSTGTIVSISSISRAASGSIAAVGGGDAIYNAGGRGGLPSTRTHEQVINSAQSQLSIPGMGQFLKFVLATRTHLTSLIKKSPNQQIPLYLLRERWDGGVPSNDPAAKAKKHRGEFAGVLPARTQKWKQFYGVSFEWVLAECLGAGLIELFETGSVGRAVRLV